MVSLLNSHDHPLITRQWWRAIVSRFQNNVNCLPGPRIIRPAECRGKGSRIRENNIARMMVFSASSFGQSTRGATEPILSYPSIPEAQRIELMRIARDTWRFYGPDVDPNTRLPMNNFGANGVGNYTSAANIGVYLWAVVAANEADVSAFETRAPHAGVHPLDDQVAL